MSVYQDKATGKYYFVCTYKDWQGKSHRKYTRGFKLARDAKAAERDFLNQQHGTNCMSFKALYELYIADCRARLKESTVISKDSLFQHSILPFFQRFDNIGNITPAHVRQWQNELLTKYKPTSCRRIHSQLSAIFNFAVKYYGLARNVACIAGGIGKRKADSSSYWTLEEFDKAIEQVQTLQDKAALTVLFYSGLRVGELLALTVADYDNKANTITVTKTLSRTATGYVIAPPKTPKSRRTVTIPCKASAVLNAYIATLYEPQPRDTIFIGLNGNHLAYVIKLAAAGADVKKIRVHDLRHSHASLLINNGANIKAVSERLGHDDIKTTLNTYGHLYKNQDNALAAMLDKL